MFLFIYFWRSLGNSNPCFRRGEGNAARLRPSESSIFAFDIDLVVGTLFLDKLVPTRYCAHHKEIQSGDGEQWTTRRVRFNVLELCYPFCRPRRHAMRGIAASFLSLKILHCDYMPPAANGDYGGRSRRYGANPAKAGIQKRGGPPPPVFPGAPVAPAAVQYGFPAGPGLVPLYPQKRTRIGGSPALGGAIMRRMKVEEIAEAIAKLPPDQLARFRRWFTAFEAGRGDHAKELDSTATKLGRLTGRAFAELKKRGTES